MATKILLDNGHGSDTPGKRSPDGTLHEWEFTRRLAARLAGRLNNAGISSKLIVPETADIPLGDRVRRVAAESAAARCLLVSLHVNASGCGAWGNARGFSAWVAPKASAAACSFAAAVAAEARRCGLEGNRRPGPRGYYEGNFAILRRTPCPAVLTENMFMDNASDLAWLLGPEAVEVLADVHFKAISAYVQG